MSMSLYRDHDRDQHYKNNAFTQLHKLLFCHVVSINIATSITVISIINI